MDDRQILFAECFLLLAIGDGGPEELLGDQGQSRPDVARYLNWDARDRAQVQEALEERCREVALDRDGDWLTYAVVWQKNGKLIYAILGHEWRALTSAARSG